MIINRHFVLIEETPERVFFLIERMPNKFPVYRILETKPFIFIRMLLVDGFKTAVKLSKYNKSTSDMILNIGDGFGPFTLTELKNPNKYWFTLKSLFFNCQTGYIIEQQGQKTQLSLDIIADNPSKAERFWWFFIKPIHGIMSRKVLKEIKNRVNQVKTHGNNV